MKKLTTNFPHHEHIVRWCLEKELGLSDYNLNIQQVKVGLGIGVKGVFLQPRHIFIDWNTIRAGEAVQTLFHELRHFYQYVHNLFPDQVEILVQHNQQNTQIANMSEAEMWQADYWHHLDYLNFPWEVDARQFSAKAWQHYLQHGREESRRFKWMRNYEGYTQ